MNNFPNDSSHSLQHLLLRLELKSNGVLSSICFLLALKSLEMNSMSDVMYGNKKVVILNQFDNTFSWIDELWLLDTKYRRYGGVSGHMGLKILWNLWWIFINHLKANRCWSSKINFSYWYYITYRSHGRKKALHMIAFHNGLEKRDYASTKRPATV